MKLYWRYKKDGKWTWAPARVEVDNDTPPEVEEERLKLEYRLMQLSLQESAQSDFLSFCRYVWPEAIIDAHHKKMSASFNRIINGSLKRLIINMPPRHTKSEFAS